MVVIHLCTLGHHQKKKPEPEKVSAKQKQEVCLYKQPGMEPIVSQEERAIELLRHAETYYLFL
jgi:hypothetical protein